MSTEVMSATTEVLPVDLFSLKSDIRYWGSKIGGFHKDRILIIGNKQDMIRRMRLITNLDKKKLYKNGT